MQDQDRIDSWVANYSVMLSAFGQEQGLVCVKVITDTAPDPGGRLGCHGPFDARRPPRPSWPALVMDECVADLPQRRRENDDLHRTHLPGSSVQPEKRQSAPSPQNWLGSIPRLVQLASAAGGGSVEMVSADELARVVRVAYDPAIQASMEAADIDGDPERVRLDRRRPGRLLRTVGRPVSRLRPLDHLRNAGGPA